MPLYEYECDACHHRFERIRKFSDPPLETCPACGGPVHKLASSPAFHLKGTGWYATDYGKKDSGGGGSSKKSDESKDSAKSGDGAASKSEKSDSKPAESSPAPAASKEASKA